MFLFVGMVHTLPLDLSLAWNVPGIVTHQNRQLEASRTAKLALPIPSPTSRLLLGRPSADVSSSLLFPWAWVICVKALWAD